MSVCADHKRGDIIVNYLAVLLMTDHNGGFWALYTIEYYHLLIVKAASYMYFCTLMGLNNFGGRLPVSSRMKGNCMQYSCRAKVKTDDHLKACFG